MSTSMNARFEPRRNALNALRLALAAAVLVSHSWPLSGREPEPHLGGANLGTWAVLGFFGISGYLITRSRLSGRPARDFYRARALRIMPALIVALIVVAFVFAPLSLLLDPTATWDPLSSVTFVARNVFLYPPAPFAQPGIADTLTNVPYPLLWDGPLWTLFWEGCCYLGIGVAVSILPRRVLPAAALAAFVALTAVSLAGAFGAPVPELALRVIPMVLAFVGGMLVLLFGDSLRQNAMTIVAAAIVIALAVMLGLVPSLAPLPLAYLLLVMGNVLPLTKVGAEYDMSYGVYIYAWPVQQLLALAGVAELPLPAYIASVALGTLPLAFLSCWLIERPALRLKGRRVERAAQEAPTP
jgi:peptidoglycan/LPS O-acetylase OafA/YrhL